MESFKQTFRQFRDLFRSMSPSQQGTLVIIPVVIIAALFFIMVRDPASSYVPLSWGKSFSGDELASATKALREKGLEDFRLEGGQILVPQNQTQRYNSALLEGNALPSDWTVALEKQLNVSTFTPSTTMEMRKDMVLQRGLALMISHAPDIDTAEVYFVRSKRKHWRHSKTPQVTAMVSFMPKGGQKLSISRINSLRYAVASAVGGGLQLEDVIIYDNHYGHSYRAKKENDPSQNPLLNHQREYVSYYEEKVHGVLDYIEGVRIGVEVKLDDTKTWSISTRAIDTKKSLAIFTDERTQKRDSNQRPPSGEPGVSSNVGGLNLNSGGGKNKSESSSDTKTKTVLTPSFKDEFKDHFPAPPTSVSVSVSIPEDYYLHVAAAEQGLTKGETEEELAEYRKQAKQAAEQQGIEKIVNDRINEIVRGTIGGDETTNPVTVTKYVSIYSKPKEVTTSITQTATQFFGNWGAAIGLALFALWALRMLSKSTAQLPAEEPEAQPHQITLKRTVEQEDEDEVQEDFASDSSKRDNLQSVVRDNPEMTASVLGKWLQIDK